MRRVARMPSGVAALPSPSRFALTFMLSASSVCASRDARGNNRRSTGCSSLDSPAAMPLRRMTSITPDHRQIMPPTVRQNVTACCTPCAAAAPTAALCPVAAP